MTTPKGKKQVRGKRVLIVDDEAGTVEVLSAVLADAGIQAIGVLNGRDALAKLATKRPDLILLDYMMPGLDGIEVIHALKQHSRFANISVVMMSGIPESMIKRRGNGYDAFLRKPFSLQELLLTVNRLLV